jgi:hypothetical protein
MAQGNTPPTCLHNALNNQLHSPLQNVKHQHLKRFSWFHGVFSIYVKSKTSAAAAAATAARLKIPNTSPTGACCAGRWMWVVIYLVTIPIHLPVRHTPQAIRTYAVTLLAFEPQRCEALSLAFASLTAAAVYHLKLKPMNPKPRRVLCRQVM